MRLPDGCREVHVMPRNDLIKHDTDEDCICGPDPLCVDGGWVYKHHSLDNRELAERR